METTTMHEQGIISAANKIWQHWTLMWNGDLPKADPLIEDGFCLHLTSTKNAIAEEINNAGKVKEFVIATRAKFQTIVYETLAGPFIDTRQKTLCCHWKAMGIYSGNSGMPTDIAGTGFLIEGTDILKFNNGKIYECWTQSNPVINT